MKTDLEIARQTALLPIGEVARLAGIDEAALEPHGRDKAKLDLAQMDALRRKPGKLILVTAINPTPAGEGKTTTTIGLGDALRLLGKNAMLALREPSLSKPVFGLKGRGDRGAAMRRSRRWRTSISISRATSMPSARRTTCWRLWSTTISIRATS